MALKHAQRRRHQASAGSDTASTAFSQELSQLRAVASGTVAAEPLHAGLSKRLRVYAAATTWMAAIFALIYVVGPIGLAVFGWTGALGSVFLNAFAFAVTMPAILLMLEWQRPSMNIGRTVDPVLPIALGSFVTWATLQNGLLRPFAAFDTVELLAYLSLNGIEFILFAMFFGTMVQSRLGGFALGVAFQVAYIAAFIMGFGLLV